MKKERLTPEERKAKRAERHRLWRPRQPGEPPIPFGAVPVNRSELEPSHSWSSTDFDDRGYYLDAPFTCCDCGRDEVWTARQQKWWYEVAKGDQFTTARRCRSCRRKERARKTEARRVHLRGALMGKEDCMLPLITEKMIPLLAGDDEDFARLARKVLAKVLHKHPHKLVLVLCLERALDIEHLGIAGMIPFSGGVSGSQITLPEVPSSRLLRQSRWVADELPGLWKEKSCPPLFGDRDKDWNLRNFLRTALASGLFFFYSRALTTSKIAAITLHYSHRSGVRSWQAQFQRSKSWKISTTLGITKEEVSALLDRAP